MSERKKPRDKCKQCKTYFETGVQQLGHTRPKLCVECAKTVCCLCLKTLTEEEKKRTSTVP